MMRTCLLAALSLAACVSFAPGQASPLGRPPSPLLYLRFHGTPGTRVAFWHPSGKIREYEVPSNLGVRPGYIYRMRLDSIPGHPGLVLYPTLEVRGSLHLPIGQKASEHPAPIVLNATDLEQLERGIFLTKVVYLENPEKAPPVATRPDQPLETTLPPGGRELVDAAREFGRPMVIIRVGARPITAAEMQEESIPGTILFPEENSLMPPRVPPVVPWTCVPVWDPVLGPLPPDEECLRDGGDVGRPAGIGRDGRAGNVDPSDTVAEYTDARGRRQLAKSNRICLCVPRFAVLRTEQPLAGYDMARGPDDTRKEYVLARERRSLPPLDTANREAPQGVKMRLRPGSNIGETSIGGLLLLQVLRGYEMDVGPGTLIASKRAVQLTEEQRTRMLRQMKFAQSFQRAEGTSATVQGLATSVIGRVEGLGEFTQTLDTREASCLCGEPAQILIDKPMLLCKWADRDHAQIGDVVTFYVKFVNNGSKPIRDLAVTDSLTPRLEYIPNSSKSERNAVFTMQENESGSLKLRWEITGEVNPGQGGVVSFQARIR